MKSSDKVEKNYIGSKGEKYHHIKHDASPLVLKLIARSRGKKFQIYVSEDNRVLEFGVGSGWNLSELKAIEKVGYDIYRSKFLPKNKSIIFQNDLRKIKNNYFDVVICYHVLEHVPNPTLSLDQIKSKLNKNGRIILVLPFEKERRYQKYNPRDINNHIFSWNMQTISNLLKFSGYRIEIARILTYGYDRRAGKIAERLHLGEFGYLLIRKFLQIIKPAKELFIIAKK